MPRADPRTALHRGLLAQLHAAPDRVVPFARACHFCGAPTHGRHGPQEIPVCVYGQGCGVEREADATPVLFVKMNRI